MTFPSSVATKLTNAINVAFKKIGNTNGTSLPSLPKQKNTEAVVWEFHVASQLSRVAEARKKEAMKACIDTGVVADSEKSPSAPGTKTMLFVGTAVALTLSVDSKPGERVDIKLLRSTLISEGVDSKTVDACISASTTQNKLAHKYSTSLLTNGD